MCACVFRFTIFSLGREKKAQRMASIYNPSSEEWIALLVFLGSSALAAFAFVHSAASYHWKMYFRRADIYHPPFFIPELYSTLRVCAWVLIGLGVWFGWREGFRSEETPPVPVSGDIPTVNDFFLLNLFYLIFLITSVAFAFSFFGLGFNMGWMGAVVFFDVATLAMVILIVIYGWKIWFLSGMLALIGGVYALYSVIMVFLLWLYRPPILENVYVDPFENAHAMGEHYLIASKQQPRVDSVSPNTSARGLYPTSTAVASARTPSPSKMPTSAPISASTKSIPHPLTQPQDTQHLATLKFQ